MFTAFPADILWANTSVDSKPLIMSMLDMVVIANAAAAKLQSH